MTEPKAPASGHWFKAPDHVQRKPDGTETRATVYDSGEGVRILSTVEDIDGVPHFHVAISMLWRRPAREPIRRALKDFGMEKAEERNLPKGNTRHFWLPVEGP